MKKKAIIFCILVILIIFIFGVYFMLEKQKEITYIAIIEQIEGNNVYINELEGKNNHTRIDYCWFSTKNVKILDDNNNKIEVKDLQVGDTIIIIAKPKIITYTNPVHIDNVKLIKLVYKSAK